MALWQRSGWHYHPKPILAIELPRLMLCVHQNQWWMPLQLQRVEKTE
jgi:hypothetical protein